MAIDLTKPLDVAYPVAFRSEGDTTMAAFGKHIQEIERIYGIINALNADKISASDFNTRLNNHINSSNPHPNLDLANTKGNLSTSRLDGTIAMSKITGDLASSRISGNFDSSKITGNFSTSRITGLADYIKSQSTGGITAGSVNANGYAKFGNGLMIQWGECSANTTISFPIAFTNVCCSLTCNIHHDNGSLDSSGHGFVVVKSLSKTSATIVAFHPYFKKSQDQQSLGATYSGGLEFISPVSVYWIALGY